MLAEVPEERGREEARVPVGEALLRDPVGVDGAGAGPGAEDVELPGALDRQWAQHHGVQQGEDGGVGADPQGEGEDHGAGEDRVPPEGAGPVAEVLEERLDQGEGPRVAAVLSSPGAGCRRPAARLAGPPPPTSRPPGFPRPHLDVKPHLLLQVSIDSGSLKEGPSRFQSAARVSMSVLRSHAGSRMRAMAPETREYEARSTSSWRRPWRLSR